jgi:hypothetical protein
MSGQNGVEERLAVLETEVAELKRSLRPGETWFNRVAGSMKDDPEFDEVLRLGREIRRADRPVEASDAES